MKRPKFGGSIVAGTAPESGNLMNNANNDDRPSSNNNRPNSLHLDLLYKEGYAANTPSKEMTGHHGTTGSGIGGFAGLLNTPGNELITPLMSHLTGTWNGLGTYTYSQEMDYLFGHSLDKILENLWVQNIFQIEEGFSVLIKFGSPFLLIVRRKKVNVPLWVIHQD
jgi:hypothetical protein